ncbi:MAG: bifunctional homocysteine S-methyltransferase/5,10-methylenetetrahydrofolate reductase protein [Methanomassiliicoccales archaeon PtaU1.Bin124]|nr:MAG: bifunctional homocysteine S-methyltransferase/5,10-methylenetetrahydrofolate reductase protein [Methanomassiliicoccales archaeon PtaU1.Bin124]
MMSNLQSVLSSGRMAVTAEIGPPKSADAETVRKLARHLKGSADAFNLTDNQTAMVRLSSIASGVVCLQEGVEPIVQMTCRDRNRIAMQSDALGASALGIRNILCLSGDHQCFGNQKEAKNVYDVDSIGQLMLLRKMRDEGQVWGGDKLEKAPELFLGAAANPFADPFEHRVVRLAKKLAAGADFIQTQSIYDVDRFERWMSQVRARGLHEKVHIIAGVMPLKSHKVALYMKNKVSGMIVPDHIIDRMKNAADPKEEGIRMCVEQIKHLQSIEGVHGIHVMAVAWEEKVPVIVKEAGLLPRPVV